MAKIITFPLMLRSPEKRRLRDIEIIPFPFGRRRYLVEQHASEMRMLDPDAAEQYLDRVLKGLCSDLRSIGIDCEDCECEAMLDFIAAIGRELHGPSFVLRIEGGAE